MKYSIVVPVYGVEKYLDTCVNSILAQSYKDFEVILVDDRSPDRCPAMCDEYAQADARIRVIHKPVNEGLGFARNTGLTAAQGEYVLFLDSDDHIAPTLLESCDAVLTDGLDMLVFGVEFCYENKAGNTTRTESLKPDRLSADTPEAKARLFTHLNQRRIFQFAWNKLYRRDFLMASGLLFEQTKLIEDFLFNIAAFTCAETIGTLDECFYRYRKPAHETLASKYCAEFFELIKRKYLLEKRFLLSCDALSGEAQEGILQAYLKHLVAAVIKNRSRAAGLSTAQQKQAVEVMMTDPVTVEVIAQYEPHSLQYKLICGSIQNKRIGFFRLFCIGVEFVQKHLAPIFRKLA